MGDGDFVCEAAEMAARHARWSQRRGPVANQEADGTPSGHVDGQRHCHRNKPCCREDIPLAALPIVKGAAAWTGSLVPALAPKSAGLQVNAMCRCRSAGANRLTKSYTAALRTAADCVCWS